MIFVRESSHAMRHNLDYPEVEEMWLPNISTHPNHEIKYTQLLLMRTLDFFPWTKPFGSLGFFLQQLSWPSSVGRCVDREVGLPTMQKYSKWKSRFFVNLLASCPPPSEGRGVIVQMMHYTRHCASCENIRGTKFLVRRLRKITGSPIQSHQKYQSRFQKNSEKCK